VPRLAEIGLDGTFFAGAVAITGFAMLLCGLAPAVMTSRVPPQAALRTARQSASRSSRLATGARGDADRARGARLYAAGLVGQPHRAEARSSRSAVAAPHRRLAFGTTRSTGEAGRAARQLLLEVRAIPGILSVFFVVAVFFSGADGFDGQLAAEG
jgi:hypothetical protein